MSPLVSIQLLYFACCRSNQIGSFYASLPLFGAIDREIIDIIATFPTNFSFLEKLKKSLLIIDQSTGISSSVKLDWLAVNFNLLSHAYVSNEKLMRFERESFKHSYLLEDLNSVMQCINSCDALSDFVNGFYLQAVAALHATLQDEWALKAVCEEVGVASVGVSYAYHYF